MANQNVTNIAMDRIWRPTESGNYRFLLYAGSNVASPGTSIRFDGNSTYPVQLTITDLGLTTDPSGVNPVYGTDVRKITKTLSFDPVTVANYGADGNLEIWKYGAVDATVNGFTVGPFNSAYAIYDQTIASSDPAALPSGATITKVEVLIGLSTGEGNLVRLNPANGVTGPYGTYGSIPGKGATTYKYLTGQYYSPTWVDITSMGTASQWADASTATRYRGIVFRGDEYGLTGRFYFGKLRITYNIIE